MNGLADVHGVGTHLDRQRDLANHVAGVGADHAATQNPAMSMGFFAVIEQQLGETFVTAVRYGTARRSPGEQAFFDLDALGITRGAFLQRRRNLVYDSHPPNEDFALVPCAPNRPRGVA